MVLDLGNDSRLALGFGFKKLIQIENTTLATGIYYLHMAEKTSLADLVLVYLARLQNLAGKLDQTAFPSWFTYLGSLVA